MKELTLQEIKEVEFSLLKVFAAFCEENHIKYYLAHGTLLGAIRYQKFIPWDDDIDLLIPREDYNRLLTLYQDNDRYRLFAFEKDQNYRYPFAKFSDMTTRKIEIGHAEGIERGLDLDLFPLDAWNDDLEKAKKEARSLKRKMFFLSLAKRDKPDSLHPVKRFVKGIVMSVCKMLGYKYFVKSILKASYKAGQTGSKYLGCKAWCVYGERGIIPAEAFAETASVEFEGETFPAPGDYDLYLTCLFGDYLPEPPKEKQKTHHNFKAYKL